MITCTTIRHKGKLPLGTVTRLTDEEFHRHSLQYRLLALRTIGLYQEMLCYWDIELITKSIFQR